MLPTLAHWDSTRSALHQAAQVVGAIRRYQAPAQANNHHLPLQVTPNGLTSGSLATGGRLALNMRSLQLIYTCPAHIAYPVNIAGESQADLLLAVQATMKKAGYPAAAARLPEPAQQTPLLPDLFTAGAYADALYQVYTAFSRFRAHLNGAQTALVVWPHGFDLSMLWFKQGFEERSDPHLNFGFSPASPGLDRPYVYMYAYPAPAGWLDTPLPEGARWQQTGWTGVVVPYDSLVGQAQPESLLEGILLQLFASFAPQLA